MKAKESLATGEKEPRRSSRPPSMQHKKKPMLLPQGGAESATLEGASP